MRSKMADMTTKIRLLLKSNNFIKFVIFVMLLFFTFSAGFNIAILAEVQKVFIGFYL